MQAAEERVSLNRLISAKLSSEQGAVASYSIPLNISESPGLGSNY